MKKISVLVATAVVAMGMVSCGGGSHKSASLKTGADSVSYAIGITTGAGYKENLKTEIQYFSLSLAHFTS